MKKDVLRLSLVFLLCLNASIPSVYLTVTQVDIADDAIGGPGGDSWQYARMFRGTPLQQVPKPFRYRVLEPALARLVPSPPEALTHKVWDVSPDKILKFKFGVVNLVALGLGGTFVFLLCETLGFATLYALLGSFLYLTVHAVVTLGGAPMTDVLSFFFLAAGIVCVLRGWSLGLLVTMAIGMFARETMAYVLIPIVLLDMPWRRRLRNVLLCAPGFLAYVVLRHVLAPTERGWNYSVGGVFEMLRYNAATPSRLIWIVSDGGLAFGVLWLLALAGWLGLVRRRAWGDPMFRLAALVPFAIAVPIMLNANIGRLFTLAFPAVIPLALLPIRDVFSERARREVRAAA